METISTQQRIADKRDKLAFYRGQIAQEWTLLTSRVGSLITSQSFLVTAFTISLGNSNPRWGDRFTLYYPLALAVIGLSITLYSFPAITGASRVIALWHKKQDRLFLMNPDEAESNPAVAVMDSEMSDYHDGRPLSKARGSGGMQIDSIQEESLRFSLIIPPLFCVTWAALVLIVLTLRLMR